MKITIKILTALPFYLILRPLIKRNYRLREQGLLPDEWYWADVIALRCGWYVSGK